MKDDFVLDITLYIIILFILFVSNVPWIEIGSFIILIILFIYGTIKFRAWFIDRREEAIRNLSDFLDQVILTLEINSASYEGFKFPEGFNYWYEISADNQTLHKFSKLKPWLGWRTKRYNKFCNQIDTMIRHFRNESREQRIIHSIRTSQDGQEYVLEDRYERYSREQCNILLEGEGLIGDKESIEQLLRKLPNKSTKLLSKFQRLRTKWMGI